MAVVAVVGMLGSGQGQGSGPGSKLGMGLESGLEMAMWVSRAAGVMKLGLVMVAGQGHGEVVCFRQPLVRRQVAVMATAAHWLIPVR